jgi:hypothetical protein
MVRTVGGVIAGILAGILGIVAISYVGGILFPIVIDSRIEGAIEQANAALANAPLGATLFIALSWFVGGLVGGVVAKRIAGTGTACWTAVGLLTLLTVSNILLAPFPGWMQVASVVAPLLGGLIANHLVAARDHSVEAEVETPLEG